LMRTCRRALEAFRAKLKALVATSPASRASDVIDKECWYAGVRLWLEASVGRVAAIRSESGVKPTCQDGPAIDPSRSLEIKFCCDAQERHS
jgi:hypothetical protein